MFYCCASSTSFRSNILNNVPIPLSKFNRRISIKIACDLTILFPVSASASGLDRCVKSSSSQAAEQSQISKSFSPLDPAVLRALCTFSSFPKKKKLSSRAPRPPLSVGLRKWENTPLCLLSCCYFSALNLAGVF
ncbi:hypothetical protein TRVL_05684 [Trypanosoma vivax]|nr:hypothetical protein TRVL_05684 [Trypanosoma vivax]